MKTPDEAIPAEASLKSLYPNLNEQKLAEADDRWCRYVALAVRVYERLLADTDVYRQFRTLTEDSERATMLRAERPTAESIQSVPPP